ncbi:RNAse P Rpr2/Rpp21/SNM1 subunit domain-containing protein [Mycena vulgaris]|nr:RNAse P Rpr2/Rpp21/SNM1 subunit domain-containing protein [Mycena vulgaris]
MAKKTNDAPPTAASIANRDIMQRLNFMYQASVYLAAVLPVPTAPPTEPAPRKQGRAHGKGKDKRPKKARKMGVHDLSTAYVHAMNTVARKTMVKMDPAVKRTLCSGCSTVLVPGSTASVRVKSSKVHGHVMHYRCAACGATRRIPAPPTLEPDSEATPAIPAASSSTTASTAMDIDTSLPNSAPNPNPTHKPARKSIARPPPLFARAGHVVLCGNDALSADAQQGDGVWIT